MQQNFILLGIRKLHSEHIIFDPYFIEIPKKALICFSRIKMGFQTYNRDDFCYTWPKLQFIFCNDWWINWPHFPDYWNSRIIILYLSPGHPANVNNTWCKFHLPEKGKNLKLCLHTGSSKKFNEIHSAIFSSCLVPQYVGVVPENKN